MFHYCVAQWLSASPLGSCQHCTFLDVPIWQSFLIQLSVTWVWDETLMCFAGGPPGATFISFLQKCNIWLHREYSHVYKEVTIYCSSCTKHIIAKLKCCNECFASLIIVDRCIEFMSCLLCCHASWGCLTCYIYPAVNDTWINRKIRFA